MKNSREIVGELIKYHREKKGLTMQKLAERLGTRRQYVWKLEKGKVNLTLNYIDKVIEKLGIKLSDIFNTTYLN
jgi:HTH-type transcriptional regulator / antitoxin HipB